MVESWAYEVVTQMNDYTPDYAIGISRGGWISAVLLSKMANVWPLDRICIEEDIEPRIVKGLLTLDDAFLNGKKVLLVADVINTGKTVMLAEEYLMGNGAEVKTACFIARTCSEIVPNYVYAERVSFKVVFPWEQRSQKEELFKKDEPFNF